MEILKELAGEDSVHDSGLAEHFRYLKVLWSVAKRIERL